MKKMLFLAVCCCAFLATGCGKEDYEFSDFKYKRDGENVEIVGKIKNNTGKDCPFLKVDYEYSSGSLTEENSFTYMDVLSGKITDISGPTDDVTVDEVNDYKIKVKKITCID